MTTIKLPSFRRKLPIGTIILFLLFLLGVYAAVVRLVNGFSVGTNLSDLRPWGIWISFDLLVGVAISSGAFVLAATVHIFHLKKYNPILRPALLTGFLGYLLVILALLVDLGQPQRIWHMLVYRNLHSPLFEVGMCVMAYTMVLFIEFSPPLLEKLGWYEPLKALQKISLPVVILGVVLSTMHQSSLGSLFLIVPYRMHPLWYTSLLPLIFLVYAIAVGFGMVIIEYVVSHRFLGGEVRPGILRGLGKGLLGTLIILLLVKVGDLLNAGELGLILENSLQGKMFLLENVVGIILPIGLLLISRRRGNIKWVFRAGVLAVMGLVLHRFNLSLIGMAGAAYTPHWLEIALTVGLFSGGILVFGLALKHLPLDGHEVPMNS